MSEREPARLEFLARQQDRMLAELASLRDDVPNVEKGRRRCHCDNGSTGFIAAPEVASNLSGTCARV